MEKSPLTVKEYKIYMVGETHWQECLKKPVNYIDGSLLNDIKTSYLLSTTTGNIHGKRKTPVSSCSWFPPFSVESNATHFRTHEAAGDLSTSMKSSNRTYRMQRPLLFPQVIFVSRSGTPSIFLRLCCVTTAFPEHGLPADAFHKSFQSLGAELPENY